MHVELTRKDGGSWYGCWLDQFERIWRAAQHPDDPAWPLRSRGYGPRRISDQRQPREGLTIMAYTRAQMMESRAEGRKLTEALCRGVRPDPVAVPIQLQRGESCYAYNSAQIWQYLEGDGTYIHKSRGGFGFLGVALVTGTAIGNSARKSKAAREAAPRFRPIDQGQLFLSDRRFAFQGQTQWADIWFDDIRMSTCDGTSITLHISGAPPAQLHTWPIDYYFALFHFLSNGNIVQIPADPS